MTSKYREALECVVQVLADAGRVDTDRSDGEVDASIRALRDLVDRFEKGVPVGAWKGEQGWHAHSWDSERLDGHSFPQQREALLLLPDDET